MSPTTLDEAAKRLQREIADRAGMPDDVPLDVLAEALESFAAEQVRAAVSEEREALQPFAEAHYWEVHVGERRLKTNPFRPEDVERAKAVYYGARGRGGAGT